MYINIHFNQSCSCNKEDIIKGAWPQLLVPSPSPTLGPVEHAEMEKKTPGFLPSTLEYLFYWLITFLHLLKTSRLLSVIILPPSGLKRWPCVAPSGAISPLLTVVTLKLLLDVCCGIFPSSTFLKENKHFN